MNRRILLQSGAAMLAWPALLLAQTAKRFRIGYLAGSNEASTRPFEEALVAGLRDLGYVVGRNLIVDMRYARGDYSRLPALAEELIALKPDILVGIEATAGAMRAKTTTIPIVLLVSIDPVAAGLVQSLARPGTNVTGMTYRLDELVAKHIELLTELVPRMSRVAVVNYAATMNTADARLAVRYEQVAKRAAAAKGLTLLVARARNAEGLEQAFAELQSEQPEGIVIAPTAPIFQLRHEIIRHARRLRVPSIGALDAAWSEAGGLVSYGPNYVKNARYGATFVHRILKGANPADVPVEQPEFEFIVNLKTAREIALTIPPSILLRADRVIE